MNFVVSVFGRHGYKHVLTLSSSRDRRKGRPPPNLSRVWPIGSLLFLNTRAGLQSLLLSLSQDKAALNHSANGTFRSLTGRLDEDDFQVPNMLWLPLPSFSHTAVFCQSRSGGIGRGVDWFIFHSYSPTVPSRSSNNSGGEAGADQWLPGCPIINDGSDGGGTISRPTSATTSASNSFKGPKIRESWVQFNIIFFLIKQKTFSIWL